jgi:hypothetical protein
LTSRVSDYPSIVAAMDDTAELVILNNQFIEAFRRGSWATLEPILSDGFGYLDGSTGKIWSRRRYSVDLVANPVPMLTIDQVVVHVDGDAAIVSARSSTAAGRFSRYLDSYERRHGVWECVHACVWPLSSQTSPSEG